MAFRLEILDQFRIQDLSREIYSDLVRYGFFLRDNRGKSVRGAFVLQQAGGDSFQTNAIIVFNWFEELERLVPTGR